MISIEDAKMIAQKQFPTYPIYSITDIGEKWVFNYDTGTPPIPGIPFICVNKSDGGVSYMTVPPLENLDIIRKGKRIFTAK